MQPFLKAHKETQFAEHNHQNKPLRSVDTYYENLFPHIPYKTTPGGGYKQFAINLPRGNVPGVFACRCGVGVLRGVGGSLT